MAEPLEESSWHVVGESYPNADGSSRQDEVRRCQPGEIVSLRPEPDNPHDPEAVAVFSARGVQVGYLGRDDASFYLFELEEGHRIDATVECVIGGGPGKPNVGLVLEVLIYED